MSDDARRLFFALWPPDAVRGRIETQAERVRGSTDGRAVPLANLHLTLAFLGKVPMAEIPAIRAAARDVGSGGFTLRIDRAGWWRKTGILWLAPSEPPPGLNRLVKDLWERLRPLGFKADFHKFRPHITIARKCGKDPETDFEPVTWAVEKLALLESDTDPKGAIYSLLDWWPLNPPDAIENDGCRDDRSVE